MRGRLGIRCPVPDIVAASKMGDHVERDEWVKEMDVSGQLEFAGKYIYGQGDVGGSGTGSFSKEKELELKV